MMKTVTSILYVHFGDNWIRGSERCLIDLIDSIDKQRFTPIVWTNNPTLYEQLQLKQVTTYLTKFTILFGWEKPRFSIFKWLTQLTFAHQLIKKHHINAIHVNSGAPCQWMWIISKLCSIPMVLHLHSDYALRDRITLGFHQSQHIVTVSKAISRHLLTDGYASYRHDTIYNSFVTSKPKCQHSIDVKKRLNINEDGYLLVTCGSLIKRKGMDKIIKMLSELTKVDTDYHLVIIGQGPEFLSLTTLSKNLNVDKNVHFVGEQSNVSSWLSGGVDVFISGATSEAFGLVIGEAAIAKLPIIAPKTGGIPEIVENNKSAILYSKWEQTKIIKHVLHVRYNPIFSKQLGVNAYQKISRDFLIQKYSNAFETLYDRLISSNLPPPTTFIIYLRLLPKIATILLSKILVRLSLFQSHNKNQFASKKII